MQIGTEEFPYVHKAMLTMSDYSSEISSDLMYDSNFLNLLNGTLEMHGTPVETTWTYLGKTVYRGENQITLQKSVDWKLGSEIVIATTGDYLGQKETESRRIVNINGSILTLNEALNFAHLSVKRVVYDIDVEIRAEVGILTRNIVFQG